MYAIYTGVCVSNEIEGIYNNHHRDFSFEIFKNSFMAL